MRKLWALYINELIKIVRKPFYIVMAVVVAASAFLTAYATSDALMDEYYYYDKSTSASYLIQDLENYENEISALKSKIDTSLALLSETAAESESLDFEKETLLWEYQNICSVVADSLSYSVLQYCRLDLMIKYNVTDDGYISYLSTVMEKVAGTESLAELTEYVSEDVMSNATFAAFEEAYGELEYRLDFATTWFETTENAEDYRQILAEKDYKKYIDLENRIVMENESLSDKSKELNILCNNMILELCPDRNVDSLGKQNGYQAIKKYAEYRTAEYEGRNSNGLKLSDIEIAEYREKADRYAYAIEIKGAGFGGEIDANAERFLATVISVAAFIGGMVVVLYAASLISDEIQTGSVKSLIIAPVKRSKIFFAKLLSVATLALALAVLTFVSVLIVKLLYGLGGGAVFYEGIMGYANMPHSMYLLACILFAFLRSFIYALFALMLSAITRNSAISTGLSLFEFGAITNFFPIIFQGFYVDSIFGKLIEMFFPYYNLDLTPKIFTLNSGSVGDILGLGSLTPSYEVPLGFSVCYILVLGLCLGYIAYDSFTRRDIK